MLTSTEVLNTTTEPTLVPADLFHSATVFTTQPITELHTDNSSLVPTINTGAVDYRNGLKILSFPVSGLAFFLVSLLVTILLFVTLGLLGHLLGFHFYLSEYK